MSTSESFDKAPRLPRLTEVNVPKLLESGRVPWPSRILVCADDRPSTIDALAMAQALGRRSGGEVEVLSVLEPRIPIPATPGRDGSARCETRDRGTAAEFIRSVRTQERRVFDGRAPWSVHLAVGNPVRSILERAKRSAAELLVVGLGDRDISLRQRRVAIPALLTRYIRLPMLASASLGTALPRAAVMFLDREHPDPSVIRATLGSIEDAAFIWILVYRGTTLRAEHGVRHDKETLTKILQSVRRAAAAVSKQIVVRGVYRAGDPVEAVLALAREVDADLIAAPVHGTPGVVRALIPNVADQLLLTAPCSVLIVPEL